MKVRDILKTKKQHGQILRVTDRDPVSRALAIMVENDTGSVAVYIAERFAGMLTFREILEAVHRDRGAALDEPCGGIFSRDPHCATPDDGVDQIRNLMTAHHIRYLPVAEDGELVDIVSFYDVARAVAKQADFENRMLREYIREWPSGGGDDENNGGEK